jgi:fucose 4-O-acetylase-like acetyltransferase
LSNELQPPKAQIYFVNAAKTLAIALVVLAHLPERESTAVFINSFRMPFFFIVSGYLLKTEGISFASYVYKKFRSLLTPYYVFVVISFLAWYFVGRKYGVDAEGGYDTRKYLAGVLLAIPSKEYLGFNLPMWFLPALFTADMWLFFIRKLRLDFQWLASILLFAVGILVHENGVAGLPYGLDVSLFAVLFLHAGGRLAKSAGSPFAVHKQGIKKERLESRKHRKTALWLSAIVSFAMCIVVSQTNIAGGHVEMYRCNFNNYLLFIVGAFSGSAFVLCLSMLLPEIRLFNFFGRNTLIIMAFHLLCFSLLKGVQHFIFRIPLEMIEESMALRIVYVVLTFALLSPVIYFINRYIPELLGRKR